MSTDNSKKESPKLLLQEMVREEINKNRHGIKIWSALALSALGAIFAAAAFYKSPLPTTSAHMTTEIMEADVADYSLEKVVGITTALMTMADSQQTLKELNHALEITNKRQDEFLGSAPLFTPNPDAKWLNRHLSMTYFNAASAYLKTQDAEYLKILRGNKEVQVYVPRANESKEAEVLKSTYVLIAMLQDAIGEYKGKLSLYREVRGLTTLWSDEQFSVNDAGEPLPGGLYKMQAERILRNLNVVEL